jgi:hypothetical protein
MTQHPGRPAAPTFPCVAATGVSCPSDVEVATGTTFSCTGTVDGQAVSFTVRETDDEGNGHIDSDNSSSTRRPWAGTAR